MSFFFFPSVALDSIIHRSKPKAPPPGGAFCGGVGDIFGGGIPEGRKGAAAHGANRRQPLRKQGIPGGARRPQIR